MSDTFRDRKWRVSYKTSSVDEQGRPINVLREFYIPALSRAVKYDRVAGYFRSSGLAVASEGYTALLNRPEGHIRLIVGADLDVKDVQAILNGDEKRMTKELLHELSEPESWDEAVQDGVSLLSAMIASGRMEIRVALRKHSVTGEAITFEDTSDGYVHEKWMVMKDAAGDTIGASGSFNESLTAMKKNAENIDVFCSWNEGTDAERIREYESSFDMVWKNKNPALAVLPLPVAVRERLIIIGNTYGKIQEIDERIRKLQKKPKVLDLLRFAVLKDAPYMPGGEMLGIYTAPVEPWPHQEIVARKLVSTWPYSWMMCDEVGLGKTIESALAARSLYLSGIAKRILIAAPKSLTKQWHRELQEKAMLSFALSSASPKVSHSYIGEDAPIEDGQLFKPDLNIVSTGLIAREKHEKALGKGKGYEIVLVDEAHYARRRNPVEGDFFPADYGKLYHAIENTLQKKTSSLWMATATPMQINQIETWDLLRLAKRAAAYLDDPTLTLSYYGVLGKLVRDEDLTPEEWRFLGRSFEQLKTSDPYLWKQIQDSCVDSKNAKVLAGLAVYDQTVKHADRKYLNRPLFAASPLSRVMMRHTRSLLEVYKKNGELKSNLAHRTVLPLSAVQFTPTEKRLYDELEEYCAELNHQIQSANENARTMMGFFLNFLQLRFASSMDAICLTLERRLEKVKLTLKIGTTPHSQEELDEIIAEIKSQEDMDVDETDLDDITLDSLLKERTQSDLEWEKEALKKMITEYEGMHETPSKIQRLLVLLDTRKRPDGRLNQTVLFTRFLDSLHSIRKYLKTRNPSLRVGVYSGQEADYYDPVTLKDVSTTHEEIKRLFLAGEIDLLLCTDAAAEGLNLQSADMLINFDLGWNPMKIEQRIGRIDRIGQKYMEIFVLNMCYVGSTEEIVYGRLWERLKGANLIVGTQQISLLPVEAEDFKKLSEGKLSEEELEVKAKRKIEDQRRINASMEISAEDLYYMYKKASSYAKAIPLPADLSSVWDALERASFMETATFDNEHHIWRSQGTDSYPALEGTTSRNEITEMLPLLTWGNRRFDKFLQSQTDDLADRYPKCVKRIEVQGAQRTAVAWLAATKSGKTVLIQRYKDLENIEIDETAEISQEAIIAAEKELHNSIRERSDLYSHIKQIIDQNISFAKAQSYLVMLGACAFLEQQAATGNTGAVSAIKDMDAARDTKGKRFPLPWKKEEYIDANYVFPANIIGNQVYMPVSDVLYECIMKRCNRALNSIKHKKKSAVTVEELISNIKRSYFSNNEQ